MFTERITLADACVAVVDCEHKTAPEDPTGRAWSIGTPAMRDGRIDYGATKRISLDTYEGWTRRLRPEEGDLILAREAPVGPVVRVPPDRMVALGQRTVLLRPDPSIVDSRYLHFLLLSPEMQHSLRSMSEGSTVPHLNVADVRNFPLPPLPPLPEQRAIAEVLGALDDKIELNERMNATLDGMARALFKSWFVDFDPVRAKAEGRQPSHMDAATAALFPAAFEDSTLGPIPAGWRVVPLSDLCTTQYGYTASASKERVGPHFLRVTDINKKNWVDWSLVPYCPFEEGLEKYRLKPGDILVARMADPGKSALVDRPVDAVFASYLVRLKTPDRATSSTVFGFLKSELYAAYTEGHSGGSVQKNMNAKVIVGARLAWPPHAVLEAWDRQLRPLRDLTSANVEESSTLAELRDTLLPKLISGELRVGGAARAVEVAG